ncbi:MAG: D-alanyl-D-alanine carboxypeptidase family protein [Alphaproteobacteria bacterium]|nr:D-alanyl-D-alanine carboxypeptidase family protein [Alphaproteobacteria bacterium]
MLDTNSGQVLHAANPDTLNYPASLTKMMTLYLVFEALEAGGTTLRDELAVSATAAAQPPSKLGLEAGTTIRLYDAVLALATKSANDVATVIAEHFSGSERGFALLMTRKARMLGMSQTTFRNASGLPDPKQRTTARDISRLARSIYSTFPQYAHFFANKTFGYNGNTYRNTNKLLSNYPGMNGIKTGYIRASGFNLAASVQRDDRHIIAVVMGGKTGRKRDAKMRRILDRAFADVGRISRMMTIVARPRPKPDIGLAIAASILLAAGPMAGPEDVAALPKPAAIAIAERPESATPVLFSPGRDWAIQVGAFSRRDAAERALDAAATVVPTLRLDSGRHIVPVEDNQGTLYRARHQGLTKEEAQEACSSLWARNLPCIIAQPAS